MVFDNGPFTHFGHKGLQQCMGFDNGFSSQSNNNLGSNVISNPSHTNSPDVVNKIQDFNSGLVCEMTDFLPDYTLTMKEGEDKLVFLKISRSMFIDYLNRDRKGEQRLDAATAVVDQHKELAKNLENRIRANTGNNAVASGGNNTPNNGNSMSQNGPTGVVVVSPVGNGGQVVRTISQQPNQVAPAPINSTNNTNSNNNAMYQLLARSRNNSNSEPNIYDTKIETSPLVGSKHT